jgi:hypothetical protein
MAVVNKSIFKLCDEYLCDDIKELISEYLNNPKKDYSPAEVGIDFKLEYINNKDYELYFKHRCNILQALRKQDKPKRNYLPEEFNSQTIYKIKRYYDLSYKIYFLEGLMNNMNSEYALSWMWNKVDAKNIRENPKKACINTKKRKGAEWS